ncbi:MAG: hypothetical protein WC390_10160 [Sulfurimonas sp.]|jgi:hypothetical protein
MNLRAVVESAAPLVKIARERVFKHIPENAVEFVHGGDDAFVGDHYIQFGDFVLTPILENNMLKWNVMVYHYIPGRWNPWDGGTPPDVDEINIATVNSITEALGEVSKVETIDHLDGVCQELTYAED